MTFKVTVLPEARDRYDAIAAASPHGSNLSDQALSDLIHDLSVRPLQHENQTGLRRGTIYCHRVLHTKVPIYVEWTLSPDLEVTIDVIELTADQPLRHIAPPNAELHHLRFRVAVYGLDDDELAEAITDARAQQATKMTRAKREAHARDMQVLTDEYQRRGLPR